MIDARRIALGVGLAVVGELGVGIDAELLAQLGARLVVVVGAENAVPWA